MGAFCGKQAKITVTPLTQIDANRPGYVSDEPTTFRNFRQEVQLHDYF
jgi:hypothetical protein